MEVMWKVINFYCITDLIVMRSAMRCVHTCTLVSYSYHQVRYVLNVFMCRAVLRTLVRNSSILHSPMEAPASSNIVIHKQNSNV